MNNNKAMNVNIRMDVEHRERLEWLVDNIKPNPTITSLIWNWIDLEYERMNPTPTPDFEGEGVA